MTTFRHGTYIGSRPELKNKTAMVILVDATLVNAQFDDRALKEAYGWHVFHIRDFSLEPEIMLEGEE